MAYPFDCTHQVAPVIYRRGKDSRNVNCSLVLFSHDNNQLRAFNNDSQKNKTQPTTSYIFMFYTKIRSYSYGKISNFFGLV